jgi:hypothetical protein
MIFLLLRMITNIFVLNVKFDDQNFISFFFLLKNKFYKTRNPKFSIIIIIYCNDIIPIEAQNIEIFQLDGKK